MSESGGFERSGGIPSNSELAERTARIEEQIGHVSDTVDRIEERISNDQKTLEDQVSENTERMGTLWRMYRFGRWVITIGTAMAAAFASLVAAGLI